MNKDEEINFEKIFSKESELTKNMLKSFLDKVQYSNDIAADVIIESNNIYLSTGYYYEKRDIQISDDLLESIFSNDGGEPLDYLISDYFLINYHDNSYSFNVDKIYDKIFDEFEIDNEDEKSYFTDLIEDYNLDAINYDYSEYFEDVKKKNIKLLLSSSSEEEFDDDFSSIIDFKDFFSQMTDTNLSNRERLEIIEEGFSSKIFSSSLALFLASQNICLQDLIDYSNLELNDKNKQLLIKDILLDINENNLSSSLFITPIELDIQGIHDVLHANHSLVIPRGHLFTSYDFTNGGGGYLCVKNIDDVVTNSLNSKIVFMVNDDHYSNGNVSNSISSYYKADSYESQDYVQCKAFSPDSDFVKEYENKKPSIDFVKELDDILKKFENKPKARSRSI